MNLVISGPLNDSLRNVVFSLVKARQVVILHDQALRFVDIDDANASRQSVAHTCAIAKVDHAYVDSTTQWSAMRLLAMDMDSTLISIECIDEMASYAGKKTEVAAITEATMRGEIRDFTESLRRRVALLDGIHVEVMRKVFEERLRLSPGAIELLKVARTHNLYTLLVSGGFIYFADRLKLQLGLNAAFANILQIANGQLTGRLIDPVLDGNGKAERVQDAMKKTNCLRHEAVVIGDGANDIPMMNIVEHSIAYHAKPAARKAARYSIDYGDLTTVLDYFN